jgi:predicted nuclease of predicted toxin-antitoxin system
VIRLLADENLNHTITRSLLQLLPDLDLVTVGEVGLKGISDPQLLDWAARERRVLLSHDVRTLVGFAQNRVAEGLLMAGLVIVEGHVTIRQAIEDIALLAECSGDGEWDDKIIFLPLR